MVKKKQCTLHDYVGGGTNFVGGCTKFEGGGTGSGKSVASSSPVSSSSTTTITEELLKNKLEEISEKILKRSNFLDSLPAFIYDGMTITTLRERMHQNVHGKGYTCISHALKHANFDIELYKIFVTSQISNLMITKNNKQLKRT